MLSKLIPHLVGCRHQRLNIIQQFESKHHQRIGLCGTESLRNGFIQGLRLWHQGNGANLIILEFP